VFENAAEGFMYWYYEIVGQTGEVLEQSKAIYRTKWEAQWAGYRRLKQESNLLGMVGNAIRAKQKTD
jgi:hypothetical protein